MGLRDPNFRNLRQKLGLGGVGDFSVTLPFSGFAGRLPPLFCLQHTIEASSQVTSEPLSGLNSYG